MQNSLFSTSLRALCAAVFVLFASSAMAQSKVQATPAATTFPAEGFVYEDNNRGFLENVKVTIKDEKGDIIEDTYTDVTGKFVASLAPEHKYKVHFDKRAFTPIDTVISTVGHVLGEALYLKYAMKRLPGYIFDATISDLLSEEEKAAGKYASSVDSVKVEVYNTTKKEEAMVYNTGDSHLFNFTFEQGNHYTILLRRPGFFAKRIEANINIHGCILCFEGLGSITPGVVDNLTEKNSAGTLGANIQMRRIEMNKALKIENIYYDLSRWDIRPEAAKELDKLVAILKDNPRLIIELGSHTDSRGGNADNMTLSQKRAESAVQYIVSKGVSGDRISAKGYGEEKILNVCKDGVNCSEPEHQRNRRTEFTVTGVLREDPYETKSLKEIIEEQAFMDMILKGGNEVIQVGADGKIPENLQKDIEKQQKRANDIQNKTATPEKDLPAAPEKTTTITSKTEAKTEVKKAAKTETKKPAKTNVKVEPKAEPKAAVNVEPKVEAAVKVEPKTEPKAAVNVEPKTMNTGFKTSIENYTGYRLQLFSEKDKALTAAHPVLNEFSEVYQEEMEEKEFAYLIGEYKHVSTANAMLRQMANKYPNAKVIHYKNGKRVL
jgi:outer membrane protein OmpA-like peptidoglycan-associated protein